ncbi:TetR/AcrR family transcriptional regulator [Streptomyces sp. YS415]|uniref:TetR/AcrR family transcriptional regulator n=1 Tax=Streptomyces sp. YS415 TaxID=2944806 RepID=UPI002022471D|nr:TetR/AcrR family transcriptional regulator [Streptomyces sp. YS415]MCL7429727.1 TetR family transcriptional regulator [Streptomyces sp. YS415]
MAAGQRRSGGDLRTRTLEEATAVIAEEGLASLTMASLAKRLGTSGGHLLYYFRSKDLLLVEALRYSEATLTEERAALLARRLKPARRLELFVEMYLPTGPRDPRWMLWIELWARSGTNVELRAAQQMLDHGWQHDLEALIAAGVARGVFAVDDVPGRAVQLLALLDGLSTRVVLSQSGAERAQAVSLAHSAVAALVPTVG